jgi:YbbR domain-containing protein
MVVAQTADNIRVKVSGPRAALKKFMDNPQTQSILIDISERGDGVLDIDVPLNKIEVPMGVRVLGVRPNVIRAEVTTKQETKVEPKEATKNTEPAKSK